MNKIIFDTDPGTDDALALAVLSVYFKDNVSAIVSTYGNTDGNTTHKNMTELAALLKINSDIVKGTDKKLSGEVLEKSMDDYHGKYGLCGVKLPGAEATVYDLEYLYHKIKKDAPVIYAAVGPLTNLALLLQKHPDITEYIDKAVIMGGGYDIFNSPNQTEFNFANDPQAVSHVLESDIDIKLLPLDSTHKLKLSKTEIEEITGLTEEEEANMGSARGLMSQIFYGNYNTAVYHNENGAIIHDAAVLLYLTEGSRYKEILCGTCSDKHGHIYRCDNGKPLNIIDFDGNAQIKNMLKTTFKALELL